MRAIAVLVLSLATVSGARASSIVAVGAATDTPSVVAPSGAESLSSPAANSHPEPGNARARHVLVIRAGIMGSASAPAAPTAKATSGNTPTLRDAMTEAGQAPAVPQ
jgi:hypothetical protein